MSGVHPRMNRQGFIQRVELIWPGTLDRVVADGLDGDWLEEATSYGLVNALLLDMHLVPIFDNATPKDSLALRASFQLIEELLAEGDAEMQDAAAIEFPECLGMPTYYLKARPFAGPLLREHLDAVYNWKPDPKWRRPLNPVRDPESSS